MVDGQLFLCMGGCMKKERGTKSQRINDFQSEWICQKPSALFTLPLSAHGEPESLGLPAQGEMGRSGSPVCTSGSQLEKEGWGRKERRGEAQCWCWISAKTWMIDGNTSSTCFASASIFYAWLVRKEGKWDCPKCVIYSLFFISSCSPQMMDDCRKFFFFKQKCNRPALENLQNCWCIFCCFWNGTWRFVFQPSTKKTNKRDKERLTSFNLCGCGCKVFDNVRCWFLAVMMSLIQMADIEPWPQTTLAAPLWPEAPLISPIRAGGWWRGLGGCGDRGWKGTGKQMASYLSLLCEGCHSNRLMQGRVKKRNDRDNQGRVWRRQWSHVPLGRFVV